MEYKFKIENEITYCAQCPMRSWNNYDEPICGFNGHLIKNQYDGKLSNCPLEIVKED